MSSGGSLHSEICHNTGAQLGEGPVWDHLSRRLYWVDIEGCRLHCHEPETGTNTAWDFDGMLGAVIPCSDGRLVLAHESGLLRFDPDSGQKLFLEVLPNTDSRLRFNDGKCDGFGNLWIGTMDKNLAPAAGNLYRVDERGNWAIMVRNTTISNGMAWTKDHRYLYYIDSARYEVWRFDYNPADAVISQRIVAIKVPEEYGAPDGMTMDVEGKLWIAHWGGNCVRRWDPQTGKVIRSIEVAAPHVTSCCFGGKDLDTLYITTARSGLNSGQLEEYPYSGGLFSIKLKIRGYNVNYFNINP